MKATQAEITVRPLRFTDHLPQMREFLTVLGFSLHVSRAERWATMVGGSGEVALHDAATSAASQSGETGLAFEVADANALATQVADAEFIDTEIYDEAYGRVLRIRGAGGTELLLDERPTDLYGYERAEPRPDPRVTSMPLLFGPPTGPLDQLLTTVGFTRLDEGDDHVWRVWRGTGGGLLARHAARDDAPAGTVRLAFRTSEPLPELANRLSANGYRDVALAADPTGELTVTDPDGTAVLFQHTTT